MSIIRRVINAFKQALNEDKKQSLEDEFFKEIVNRRIRNRLIFIDTTAEFLKQKCLEDTGCVLDDVKARLLAMKFFDAAKDRGDIDILNNLKGDYNDELLR